MKIAIVGPGKLGRGLGKIWADAGHRVYVTFSREPAKLEGVAREIGAHAAGVADAIADSDVVAFTTKWAAIPDAIAQAGLPADAWAGKVVLDCTNTMSPRKNAEGLTETRSCAEVLAQMLPGAHVIKTFNQAFEQIIHAPSRRFGGEQPTMFYCGDDAGAKATAAQLIGEVDFEAVDAGPLENARYLEAYAILVIRLGHTLGLGTDIAMKLMRR